MSCRHHSKSQQRKPLEVADEELELVEWDDEPETVLLCRHPSLGGSPKQMGAPDGNPGSECELYELGRKRGLDPSLERLLSQPKR